MTFAMSTSRQSDDEVLASGEYPLTRRDLNEIAAMIYSDAGIALNDSKASLVYSRLSKHIRNLGLSGFRAYCQLVASPEGSAERREMLSHLTTNFTRFFRENHHFEHLRDEVLPGLIQRAKSGGRVRIWSAASSDGQEPYSIALTVFQAFRTFWTTTSRFSPPISIRRSSPSPDRVPMTSRLSKPCHLPSASSGSRKSRSAGAASSRSTSA